MQLVRCSKCVWSNLADAWKCPVVSCYYDNNPCIYSGKTILQVDDQQKDTDDVPHSDLPTVTAPTIDDGANQNTCDPRVCSQLIRIL